MTVNEEQTPSREESAFERQDGALRECPFCGEIPSADSHYMNQGDKWGGVQCNNCTAAGPEVRTSYQLWPGWKDAAIKEWNTRADDSLRNQNAVLRDRVKELESIQRALVNTVTQAKVEIEILPPKQLAQRQSILTAINSVLGRVK